MPSEEWEAYDSERPDDPDNFEDEQDEPGSGRILLGSPL